MQKLTEKSSRSWNDFLLLLSGGFLNGLFHSIFVVCSHTPDRILFYIQESSVDCASGGESGFLFVYRPEVCCVFSCYNCYDFFWRNKVGTAYRLSKEQH